MEFCSYFRWACVASVGGKVCKGVRVMHSHRNSRLICGRVRKFSEAIPSIRPVPTTFHVISGTTLLIARRVVNNHPFIVD